LGSDGNKTSAIPFRFSITTHKKAGGDER